MGDCGAAGAIHDATVERFAAAARAGELAVFLDFDRTVTRCFLADGRRCVSGHGLLEATLSQRVQTKGAELFQRYYPIEIDPVLPIEEKLPHMHAWYMEMHGIYVEEGITRQQLERCVAACDQIELREGVDCFLRYCQDSCPPIPVVIMSAGLGDVIEIYLRQRLPFELKSTTTIVSNRMTFSEEGMLNGFSEPLLHMYNKTAARMTESDFALVAGMGACLVVGDSLGDLTMADGLKAEKFTVGLLNERIEDRLQSYKDGFHVVCHEESFPEICFRAVGMPSTGELR